MGGVRTPPACSLTRAEPRSLRSGGYPPASPPSPTSCSQFAWGVRKPPSAQKPDLFIISDLKTHPGGRRGESTPHSCKERTNAKLAEKQEEHGPARERDRDAGSWGRDGGRRWASGTAGRSAGEGRNGRPGKLRSQAGVNAAPLLRLRSALPGHPHPVPAEDLLVSRQPFTREANQRAPLARPRPSASGRKDPVGAGSALPCPSLPGEAGLGAGQGRGRRAEAWSGRIRAKGAAAGRLTRCRCLGAPGDRAAPVGGLPTPRTCVCVSSPAVQVSPGHPSSQGARVRRLPTAARSALGGLSRPRGAQVLAEPMGVPGAGEGADRCRDRVPRAPLLPPR